MSCSSGGSGCSSAPAAASSAPYPRPGEENTYKYTLKETALCWLVATMHILSMVPIGIVASFAIYINDVVSSFPQTVPTPQSSSQNTPLPTEMSQRQLEENPETFFIIQGY
jgi:hypothetical protein